MKKVVLSLVLLMVLLVMQKPVRAQQQEIAQLLLNVEKLAQFKQILEDLKKGYAILYGGYNTIKNISEGNFQLHQVFLDGLMQVSPAVRNYKRVADIIDCQVRLVKDYKTAFVRYKNSGWFNVEELDYMGRVYDNLFDLSVKNLDDLFTIITASRLRMSDDERLAAIDKIYADMQEKLLFLRSFNNSNTILSVQRQKAGIEVERMKKLYGR